MIDVKKILVLSPHTDDGELGCGGSIAKWSAEGKEIHYIAFSDCARSLPKGLPKNTLIEECKKATQVLGIPASQVSILNYEVREFPASRQKILEELVALNNKLVPDLVLLPCAADKHQDHSVIYQEGVRAFKECNVLGYELPWNQKTFRTDLFVKLTEEQLAKKIAALKEYSSQSKRPYMKDEFARSLAMVRAVQCGADWAEAFEVYRLLA